jgi:hypothetical protein
MKDQERLTFINNITEDLLTELWDNCGFINKGIIDLAFNDNKTLKFQILL